MVYVTASILGLHGAKKCNQIKRHTPLHTPRLLTQLLCMVVSAECYCIAIGEYVEQCTTTSFVVITPRLLLSNWLHNYLCAFFVALVNDRKTLDLPSLVSEDLMQLLSCRLCAIDANHIPACIIFFLDLKYWTRYKTYYFELIITCASDVI